MMWAIRNKANPNEWAAFFENNIGYQLIESDVETETFSYPALFFDQYDAESEAMDIGGEVVPLLTPDEVESREKAAFEAAKEHRKGPFGWEDTYLEYADWKESQK